MADSTLISAVERARCGDTHAFDLLVHHYQNAAVGYARTLLRDPGAAEDAAQEAFVQAWRELPKLHEPAAFGGWLRRLVFKYCDRTRRSAHPTVPLVETIPLPVEDEPLVIAERAEERAIIRAALETLPQHLRETTLLYYWMGNDLKEIATFMNVPPTTVKNRLFAARKRLRKELWTMTETLLTQEKPSQTEEFAAQVLARILRTFQEQEASDPHTANRGLLKQGSTVLDTVLAKSDPLDWETVYTGYQVLNRQDNHKAVSALMMRALAQTWNDSQTAWLYFFLVNSIANDGNAPGAVLAYEAFERWFPGKRPYVNRRWPHHPVSENSTENTVTPEEIPLWILTNSWEFATAYVGIWRGKEYLAKIDEQLAHVTPTAQNRYARFIGLRAGTAVCEALKDYARSQSYVTRMYVLADEETAENGEQHYRAKAINHEMKLANLLGDYALFCAKIQELIALLDAIPDQTAYWVRGERHDLAHQLYFDKQYALSLKLWEKNAATGGQLGGWGWLLYATTVWVVTQDRERSLALLREARAHDDRDMRPIFEERPEFADVLNDPDFVAAVSRP